MARKRTKNLFVEAIQTDMGEIHIFLTPDNYFVATIGEGSVSADSASDIKNKIYSRIESLLRVDLFPVVEIHGSCLKDFSGSYVTEDRIRASLYFECTRYYLGVRSVDGGKTKINCQLRWDAWKEEMKARDMAGNLKDRNPLTSVAREMLKVGRDAPPNAAAELFANRPVIYKQIQGFEFEILADYSSGLWDFLTDAHNTTLDLYSRLRDIVSDTRTLNKLESSERSLAMWLQAPKTA